MKPFMTLSAIAAVAVFTFPITTVATEDGVREGKERRVSKADRAEKRAAVFQRIDADGSGGLSREEFIAMEPSYHQAHDQHKSVGSR